MRMKSNRKATVTGGVLLGSPSAIMSWPWGPCAFNLTQYQLPRPITEDAADTLVTRGKTSRHRMW